MRAKIAEQHNPATADPFQLVKIPAGVVDLGEGARELYEIDYDFYIFKYPLSEFEFFSTRNAQGIPFGRKQFPVTNVSWLDALRFCSELSDQILKKVGLDRGDKFVLRLPTEAEWRLAFRGATVMDGVENPLPRRCFPWGSDVCVEAANTPGLLGGRRLGLVPSGVCSENVSPLGVFDMLGNCAEWVSTAWGGSDPDSPVFGRPYDPRDGREEHNETDFRLALGGSWMFDDASVNCACRLSPHARHPDIGFRPVVVPAEGW